MPEEMKQEDGKQMAISPEKRVDDLEKQIELERKRQENLKAKEEEEKLIKKEQIEEDAGKKAKIEEDPNKITVERAYLTTIRDEAKGYRKELESLKEQFGKVQSVLKNQFGVDSAAALQEKLEESKKAKEKEEETKLSKVELAEKRAQSLEKQLEEERIKSETRVNELIKSRDDMIIQHSLIQAAVANDVANPRQVYQLLKDEFYVDPDRLVPLYKAEDGEMSLDERVKVFLDDPDNWNLVRSKIPMGSGSQGSVGGGGKHMFSKSELADMRHNRPEEYKERQKEILKAYAEGRIKP
jgi:hypothetical protein